MKGHIRTVAIVGIAFVVIVSAVGFWLWRSYGFLLKMRPSVGFAESAVPPAPNYDDPALWVALPTTKDEADLVPAAAGLEDAQADAPADVFFIHLTSYLQPQWNEPIRADSRAREGIERFLAGDASVFNGCCRVYAPTYRQATFYSFVTDSDDGPKALQLAYDDVHRAFKVFINKYNDGRPFIVASHSQGTLHAYRLLRDEIDPTPLRKRMVAAYVLGYTLPQKRLDQDYTHIKACDTPEATGCLVTWETWARDKRPDWPFYVWEGEAIVRQARVDDAVCVNPLTWTTTASLAAASKHLGGIVLPPLPTRDHFIRSAEHSGMTYDRLQGPHPVRTPARCTPRVLETDLLPSPPFRSMLVKGNYHLLDFTLFYFNIRSNVKQRVQAWRAAHPPPPALP